MTNPTNTNYIVSNQIENSNNNNNEQEKTYMERHEISLQPNKEKNKTKPTNYKQPPEKTSSRKPNINFWKNITNKDPNLKLYEKLYLNTSNKGIKKPSQTPTAEQEIKEQRLQRLLNLKEFKEAEKYFLRDEETNTK